MTDSWGPHMRRMAYDWLLEGRPVGCLGEALVMLLGNPDHYRPAMVAEALGEVRQKGTFLVGSLNGRPLALTRPRFGGPIVAMYLEVAAMAGVRRVVALGYTGALRAGVAVGSVFLAQEALGLDGTTAAYQRNTALPGAEALPPRVWPADAALTERVAQALTAAGLPWSAGRMASFDAIMLEESATVAALVAQGCDAVDLETAALYAVATRSRLAATSLHVVTDNPFQERVGQEHEIRPSRPRALAVAARVAIEG